MATFSCQRARRAGGDDPLGVLEVDAGSAMTGEAAALGTRKPDREAALFHWRQQQCRARPLAACSYGHPGAED